MNQKLVWVLLFTGLIVSGCSQGMVATDPGGPPPVITAHFAPVEKGRYLDPIYVYLAAEDPAGNMDRIGVQVSQVGFGVYPTSWTRLKPEYQKKFVGYLQWNTGSSDAKSMPEWTDVTINITVFDKAGSQSNAVNIPYQFVLQNFPKAPLPPPFDRGVMPRIGWINVNLVNPQQHRLR
jgi:hypothetical protein